MDDRSVNVPLVLALGTGLVLGGALFGLLFIVGCSENLHAGTTRKEVCDAIGHSAETWFLAVLWPAGVLGASQLVPWFRQHAVVVAVAIAGLIAAFWISALVIV